MPLPPPPAAALSMMGKPISSAVRTASSTVFTGPGLPGITGTPAFLAAALASSLFPMRAMVSAEGPMNTSPAFSQARAKEAFSERKPYPG